MTPIFFTSAAARVGDVEKWRLIEASRWEATTFGLVDAIIRDGSLESEAIRTVEEGSEWKKRTYSATVHAADAGTLTSHLHRKLNVVKISVTGMVLLSLFY